MKGRPITPPLREGEVYLIDWLVVRAWRLIDIAKLLRRRNADVGAAHKRRGKYADMPHFEPETNRAAIRYDQLMAARLRYYERKASEGEQAA